jgi:hypothetical protein
VNFLPLYFIEAEAERKKEECSRIPDFLKTEPFPPSQVPNWGHIFLSPKK